MTLDCQLICRGDESRAIFETKGTAVLLAGGLYKSRDLNLSDLLEESMTQA